jgi:ATP-dependent DNA helicase DinG
MSFQSRVRGAFAPAGLLSRSVAEFRPREGQIEMATAIARVLDEGGVLVVEAGTGIGKTFSYLVPALMSGTRVLLSTATKTLQDQLFGRDLPHLLQALGLQVRVALLKGRGSYLCRHRLELARKIPAISEPELIRTLARVELWAQATSTGDLAELPGLDESSAVMPWVTSSRDNCLGSQCPQLSRCHVNQARREALAADLVVINHHLFFADLVVRDSGMAELLPTVQTVIFDEAHQLNETGVQFLGKQLSTGQLLDFARDMLFSGLQHASGFLDWQTLASDVEYAARDLRMIVGKADPCAKRRWVDIVPEQVDTVEWGAALTDLEAACTRAQLALASVCEVAPDLARLWERVSALVALLELFSGACHLDSVRWLEVGAQLKLVESPLDIAETVRSRMIQSPQEGSALRSWVFTSATLGSDAKLGWFTVPCGLSNAEIIKIGSPFDYAAQAALYVPTHWPKPNDVTHSARVAELVSKSAPLIGGRTLVLTTTLRALQLISEVLQQVFQGPQSLQILVQGQQPKRELIERFRQGGLAGKMGCILIASASFWEGVDVPGEALQMVVIDKLPFPPPNDPLVEAHAKRLEAAGRSVFNSYFMQEAAMALKQGAGRLIRRESDQGVLVVCDSRLALMGYGRRLLAALPPMRRINSDEELTESLLALTRTSTTDLSRL